MRNTNFTKIELKSVKQSTKKKKFFFQFVLIVFVASRACFNKFLYGGGSTMPHTGADHGRKAN